MSTQENQSRSKSALTNPTCHESNMLKFVNDKNSARRPEGKRCHPHQQFGVSGESPDYFKAKNTLISRYGYQYQMDKNPQAKKFQYFSQQNFFTIGAPAPGQPKMQRNFSANFKESSDKNPKAFNRKKGRLSEFMDKNGWMGNTYTVIGSERSETGRDIRQIERDKKVRENQSRLLTKQKSMSATSLGRRTAPTPYTHKDMTQLLMAEKMKIRESRNELASACSGRNADLVQNSRPATSSDRWARKAINKPSTSQTSSSLAILKGDKEKDFKMNFIEWGQNPFRLRNVTWNKDRQTDTLDEREQHKFNPPLPNKQFVSQKMTMRGLAAQDNEKNMGSTNGTFSNGNRTTQFTSAKKDDEILWE